jgi:hypothetical protein
MTRDLLLFAILTAGCADDVAQPYELDHARVLAIRMEPAALAPGATGTLEVLFTDSTAVPRLAPPDALTVALAAPLADPQLWSLVQPTALGWQVHAPDAATLRAIRAGLGIRDEAPLILPLTIEVATQDGTLRAQKLVPVGASGANPAAPALRDDSGKPLTTLEIAPGDEVGVQVEAAPELEVRWFSSLGELRHYTLPAASITASSQEHGAAGSLMVVVRNQAGGVSWNLVPLQVTN